MIELPNHCSQYISGGFMIETTLIGIFSGGMIALGAKHDGIGPFGQVLGFILGLGFWTFLDEMVYFASHYLNSTTDSLFY